MAEVKKSNTNATAEEMDFSYDKEPLMQKKWSAKGASTEKEVSAEENGERILDLLLIGIKQRIQKYESLAKSEPNVEEQFVIDVALLNIYSSANTIIKVFEKYSKLSDLLKRVGEPPLLPQSLPYLSPTPATPPVPSMPSMPSMYGMLYNPFGFSPPTGQSPTGSR